MMIESAVARTDDIFGTRTTPLAASPAQRRRECLIAHPPQEIGESP